MAIVRNQLAKTLVVATIFFLPTVVFPQDGPGGIGTTGAATNLVFWLDSKRVNSDNSNPTIGAAVTSWSDKSGRGKTVTQNTTGVANYAATGVTFNNVGYLAGNDSGFPSGSSDRTAIVVASSPTTTSDDVLFFYGTSNTNQSYGILKIMSSNATSPDGIRNFFYGDDQDVAGGWTPSGTQKIAMCTYTSGTQSTYLNNNNATTKTSFTGTPNTTLGGAGALQVGGWNSFTLNSQATIAEVILFNKVLNAAEQIIINNYLAAKYGLTLVNNDLYTNDNSANGNYDFDVAGIGQGTSIASQQLDSKGTGIVEVNNVVGLNNNEYFFWGHDGASVWASTTDVPSVIQARVQRVWRGQAIGALTSFDVKVDLSGYPTSTAADLRLLVDTNNNGLFSDETVAGGGVIGPPTGSGTVFTFSGVTALTGTRRFTIGTTNKSRTALPVTLEFINAKQAGNTVELTWQTASEKNNAYFTVERSVDGHIFETITTVNAAGSTTLEKNYKIVDRNPYEGLSYYRLSQTDFDGTTKQFNPVPVNFARENADYRIFPNPASGDRFHVYIPGTERSHTVQISLEELNGKQLVSSGCDCLTAGQDNAYEVVLPHPLAPGLYLLKVTCGDEQHVLKFVAQ